MTDVSAWTLDLAHSFDTNTALSGMFLWLLFGMLAQLVNCDLTRMLNTSPWVLHGVSIVAFFFLFTVIDTSNKSNLLTTWVKTLMVYVLFLFSTKSKAYFVLPMLGLLLVDQSLKKHAEFQSVHQPEEAWGEGSVNARLVEEVRKWILVAVVLIVIVGAIDYARLQRIEYKGRFSWSKFVLGSGKPCKRVAPEYGR